MEEQIYGQLRRFDQTVNMSNMRKGITTV